MRRWLVGKGWKLAWCLLGACASVSGAPIGTVIPIGGHATDLALDEARGRLYVANFTANRIEVVSLAQLRVTGSMAVAPQPASLALSPDGRYLVVAHYGPFKPPQSPNNLLTVIDLESGTRRTFALSWPPLGVAFGIHGLALVATTQQFFLLDPKTGFLQPRETIEELMARTLPTAPGTMPAAIIAASMNVSGDGTKIYGLTDRFEFGYDVTTGRLAVLEYFSEPPQGPPVVSVNRDGTRYLAGWVLHGTAIWDWATGVWNLAEFPNASGALDRGSHAIDSVRGLVYAQIPRQVSAGSTSSTAASRPVLEVLRLDNLAVVEQLEIPENLTGKSVLSSNGQVLYAISESGITAIPVGALDQLPRLQATVEDILIEASVCDLRPVTRSFSLVDPSGRGVDFSLTVEGPGVEVTPQAGTAPATITVRVDPAALLDQRGTTVVYLRIQSRGAVNIPKPVRLLINRAEPDQRGMIVNVPGKLVDLLADPTRDRFFVLRQDTNEVLVFEGANYQKVAALPTGNRPTQMAVTFDRRYLLVGHDASQLIAVYDLETLSPVMHLRTPPGHYPRSIAAAGGTILTANRGMGGAHTIDRVDLVTRTVTELPSLGIYENKIDARTVMVASPNGAHILVVQADGQLMLYDTTARTFTVSRKESSSLAGAYAASSYGWYVAGDRLLNSSLVTTGLVGASPEQSSGFTFVDEQGFWVTTLGNLGLIYRFDALTGTLGQAVRLVEAPVVGDAEFPFRRTVAALYSRKSLIVLTTSGFTVLPWEYDAAVAPPKIHAVVNAADYTEPVAPGGLISLFGENLSPVNLATSQIPLPTALGQSCLLVNGVPTPVLFVSPTQINAQLPYHVEGNVALVLHTPGGSSDYYYLKILPAAPSIFRSGVAGDLRNLPTVIRARNNQLVTLANPIHGGDDIVIYLTGMGRTSPPVEAGVPAPADVLAQVVIPVEVTLGGEPLPIHYAGLAPGLVGVYQINAHVPWWVRPGMQQPLVVRQGGYSTTIYVRVVN